LIRFNSGTALAALGQMHVFAADGTTRRDIAPGFYADVVRS
jgi:hypothetical protein